ncbi:hypothetical protein MMC29_006019, partial [Sticta canariensis]|nr:hypothetical protein [Sticta canariensis]
MHSLILIVALLLTVLASPTLRHRLVQDVDAYGNLDDLEGNTFTAATVPDLASANPEGAGWTASIGTTPDPQGYQASTVSDNIYVGAPEQQDGLLIAKAKVKPGWVPNAQNPCPNLFTLCTKTIQYFPLGWISNAFPYDAELDPKFEECGRHDIWCCIDYVEE